jgi:hypothetical protein
MVSSMPGSVSMITRSGAASSGSASVAGCVASFSDNGTSGNDDEEEEDMLHNNEKMTNQTTKY